MLALITILDGASGLLFHVEHASNYSEGWEYRLRWPDSRAESLRDWQAVRQVAGEAAFFPLWDQVAAVEAQWRPVGGEWRDAVPHEFGAAAADFIVEMLQDRDFTADPVLRVMAMVRSQPACYDLEMPRCLMVAGESITVPGQSVNLGPGTVLRAAGDFSAVNDAFRIVNVGAGQGALQPSGGPALPGAAPYRGAFFVRSGRLPQEEIDKLLESCRKS